MKNSRKEYDLLILNNCPAFYKINLYNEIANKRKIFVIFLGHYSQVVIDVDFHEQIKFPFVILNTSLLGRNFVTSFMKLRKTIRSFKFQKIIYGGYIEPEFVLYSFLSSKRKNILQTESAGETKLLGPRFYLKKILLSRYSQALASGKIHEQMLKKMGFYNRTHITRGVGLINKSGKHPPIDLCTDVKFLYVGRIIELKNIRNLINVFNKNGLPLSIVGKGDLEDEMKSVSKDNIRWLGFIDNEDLDPIYKAHHVFILPSFAEPWGLVVEEALYRNCALLLSDKVGSINELLREPNTGISFNPYNVEDFQKAVVHMQKNYLLYRKNAADFAFEEKDFVQVSAYTEKIFEY